MVKQNEVLLKHRDEWLYFSEPHEIISVSKLEDVPEALNEVERLVEEHGWHAAGFLSYEAAPAFDPAFLTHAGDGFPLSLVRALPAAARRPASFHRIPSK